MMTGKAGGERRLAVGSEGHPSELHWMPQGSGAEQFPSRSPHCFLSPQSSQCAAWYSLWDGRPSTGR